MSVVSHAEHREWYKGLIFIDSFIHHNYHQYAKLGQE